MPIDVFWQTGHLPEGLCVPDHGKPLNKMYLQWLTPDILHYLCPVSLLKNRTARGGSVRERE